MTFDALVTAMLRSKRSRQRLMAEHRRHVRNHTHPPIVRSKVLPESPCSGRRGWRHQTTITIRLPR